MPPRTAPPSGNNGNRIPLYIALFVAVAALAIVGLRLTKNAPTSAQPVAAPAPNSQQPFPSDPTSKDQPSQQEAPASGGERYSG